MKSLKKEVYTPTPRGSYTGNVIRDLLVLVAILVFAAFLLKFAKGSLSDGNPSERAISAVVQEGYLNARITGGGECDGVTCEGCPPSAVSRHLVTASHPTTSRESDLLVCCGRFKTSCTVQPWR